MTQQVCFGCAGTGVKFKTVRDPGSPTGTSVTAEPCPHCGGKGWLPGGNQ